MLELNQMEIFYYVATWHSFSKAALELGYSKSFVSNQISALEKTLNVKLIHRTTRHLSLTDEGQIFYISCEKIIREKQLAAAITKINSEEPQGLLKISAPPSMCNSFLAEFIPLFLKNNSQLSIAIDASATVKNLIQHEIDLALRVTNTPDENYIAKLITEFKFIICATPQYLAENKTIKNPQDLKLHDCLIYSADPQKNHWPFEINNNLTHIEVGAKLWTNDISMLKNSLLHHQGIARLPAYTLVKELRQKKLSVLFEAQNNIKTPLYAIYASNQKISAKIKHFVDFLKLHLN